MGGQMHWPSYAEIVSFLLSTSSFVVNKFLVLLQCTNALIFLRLHVNFFFIYLISLISFAYHNSLNKKQSTTEICLQFGFVEWIRVNKIEIETC